MSALSVRRPLSVLAVLAMVATLLFAVAGTASAATVEPSNEATFSACPDNAAIPDAGFTDIPTASFFDDSVNCLAYYAVTKGTTPTEYGPADDVTRAQMAVFLYRMAGVAGVVLSATPPDAGFTDISGFPAEFQTAINALAAAGIVKGKTATTYAPGDPVWRQQMALFLKRFSDAATAPTTGPGGTQAKNTTGTTNNFTDLGSVTVEADTAINDVFHLGVAAGNTATTFNPLGNVNRGQMSLFLTRLAAHMNVRPLGVNLQVEPMSGFAPLSVDAAVTVRNSDFTPDANELIDIFTTEDPTKAFTTGGACVTAEVALVYGGTVCAIDGADPDSDSYGNFEFSDTVAADDLAYYAWSGASGDTFDMDTTGYSMAAVETSASGVAVEWETSKAKNSLYEQGVIDNLFADVFGYNTKYGTTITYSAQIVDAAVDGDPVAQSGVEMTLVMERRVNGAFVSSTTYKADTDATGLAEFEFTEADPNSTTVNKDDASAVFMTFASNEKGYANLIPAPLATVWDDNAAYENLVTIDAGLGYTTSTSGSVKAFVYDQYGIGMPGVVVTFDTPGVNCLMGAVANQSLAAPVDRTTGSSGATTAQPMTNANQTCDYITATIPAGVSTIDDTDFFWTKEAPDALVAAAPVEIWDDTNDRLVFQFGGVFWYAAYDANDQFRLGGAPTTFDKFDKAVKAEPTAGVYNFVDMNPYDTSTASISSFDLF